MTPRRSVPGDAVSRPSDQGRRPLITDPAHPKKSRPLRLPLTKRVAAAREWDLPEPPRDPLAAALSEALRRQDRDIPVEVLVGRLALPGDGRLTPELAMEALDHQGIAGQVTRRRLDDFKAEDLPVVLLLRGRDACVLTGRTASGDCLVVRPATSADEVPMAAEALGDAYVGHAIVMHPFSDLADTPPVAGSDRHWLWGALRPYWPEYLQVALASVIINLLALAVPLFTMNVYDRVFPNAALITLWSLVAGVGLALGFDALLKLLRAQVIDRVGRRVDQAVSARVFRHISHLGFEADLPPSGTLMNTLKDYEQVADFFSSQTLSNLIDLLFAVLFIALIYYIGGPLALPPALALVIVLVMGLIILRPLRRASERNRALGGAKTLVAAEAVTEIETLKAVAGHARMQARWEQQSAEAGAAQAKSRGLATTANTVTLLLTQASSIGIVVIGVYLALNGQITMGAVIAAMILSGRALAPTAALTGLFVRGSFALSTLQSVGALMAQRSDAQPRGRMINPGSHAGALELRGVTLSYPGAPLPALKNVSLQIPAEGRVGVIGPIGSGKTSLARAMAGFWPASEGLVLLDGLNVQQIAPETLRKTVQMVPQEAVLFSGTLAENIAFGTPGARDADILRAARDAGVDRIAASHPEGFAMRITERGRNLSGGQRQMIALARALLPRPRVLILDEPTSAMDMQSEALFISGVERALARHPMTLVVSTHRMALMRLVTQVAVMGQGQLVHFGEKEAVLAALKAPPGGESP